MNQCLVSLCSRTGITLLGMVAIAFSSPAAVLTDNLGDLTAGSDVVSGGTLLGADFSTGSSSWVLSSATLLLQMDTSGAASLNLYSDNAGIPGILLGSLVSSGAYSASLSATTFTTSGLTLNADTTYWLVLSAASGSFEWAWTQTNSGNGAGFTGDAASFDGVYWYGTKGIYPYQLSVTADHVNAAAAPEPGSISLGIIGTGGLAVFAFQRRRRRTVK